MTILGDVNNDAMTVTPERAAVGPLAGFWASYETSLDAQRKTSALYGLEYAFYEQDYKQAKVLREAGIKDAPYLNMADAAFSDQFDYDLGDVYAGAARMARDKFVDPETAKRVAEYDKRITEIQRTRPDLHLYTSKQMFEVVSRDAQQAELRDQTQRRTWGGAFGSFLGAVKASVEPTTDPLNFATLGVGGVGKTALMRILSQTGSQGAIEAVNQVTGVQESRDLMGLSSGWQDALTRVGSAAVAGGAIQAGGEALAAAGRRFFRSTPDDPAPDPRAVLDDPSKRLALPPPDQIKVEAGAARLEGNPGAYNDYLADVAPLSGIRVGKARTVADLNEMTDALDKWDAPPAAFVKPRTDAATYTADVANPRVDVSAAVGNNRLYQAARAADEPAFTRYEKLLERKETFRRWIDELSRGRAQDVDETLEKIDTRIASLEARFRSVQGIKNKTNIKAEIAEARADKAKLLEAAKTKETPDIAVVRKELAKADEQMRDLAPLIGRAYAKARGEWAPDTELMDEVWNAYKAGRTEVNAPAKDTLPDYDTAVALADRSPVMQRARPDQTGATSADTAMRVLADEAKVFDEGLEAFRQTMKNALGEAADNSLTVGNHKFSLDDRIHIELDDGTAKEMSVREMLEQNRNSETELEAITTCSMPRRS